MQRHNTNLLWKVNSFSILILNSTYALPKGKNSIKRMVLKASSESGSLPDFLHNLQIPYAI